MGFFSVVMVCFLGFSSLTAESDFWPTRNVYQSGVLDSDSEPDHLLVGSFNLWIWGKTKLEKPNITAVIVDIILHYDVVALQEIRDISNYSAKELERMVKEKDSDYEFIVSDPLGRSSQKEQYAFFYRKSKIEHADTWQYPDNKDYFERPPLITRFKYGAIDIAYANIHIKPDLAVPEMGNLTKVYDEIHWKWEPAMVLLGGDYNSDCGYITIAEWETIPLWTNDTFVWLIDNTVDTTVSSSFCTYDRFVAVGDKLAKTLVPGSANSWLYYEDMGFTLAEAKTVSDHYPIEFKLYSNWFYPPANNLE